MFPGIVGIKKIVADASKLKREHFEESERGWNEYGVRHEPVKTLTRDEKDVYSLVRFWIDERRAAGVKYVLKNTRMWLLLAVVCLAVLAIPLPKRLSFLHWIIPVVMCLCLPIVSYLLFCIELERRYMEITGVNELGSVHFNFLTGGVYLAQIKLAEVDESVIESNNSVKPNIVPLQKPTTSRHITVGFVAYRSGGDYDDTFGDDDSDNEPDQTKPENDDLKQLGRTSQKACEIAYLYVLPKYRRRGIAELLIESVCKNASEEHGYEMVYFPMPADADAGVAEFLAARGFRTVGTRARLAHRDSYKAKIESLMVNQSNRRGIFRLFFRLFSILRLALLATLSPLAAGVVTLRSQPRSAASGPVAVTSPFAALTHECRVALIGEGGEDEDLYARPLFKLDADQLAKLASRKQPTRTPTTSTPSAPGTTKKKVTFVQNHVGHEEEEEEEEEDSLHEDDDGAEGGLDTDISDDDEAYEHALLRRRHAQRQMGDSLLAARQVRPRNAGGFVPSDDILPQEPSFDQELRRIQQAARHEDNMKRKGISYLRSQRPTAHDLGDSDELEYESDTDDAGVTVTGVWAPTTSTSAAGNEVSASTGRATGSTMASRAFFERISQQAEMATRTDGSSSSTRYVETHGGPMQSVGDDQLEFLIRSGKLR